MYSFCKELNLSDMQNLYGNLLLQVPPNDTSFISLSIHDLNDSFSKPKIQDPHKNPSHLFQSIKVTFHVELPTNKFLTVDLKNSLSPS